MAYVKFFSDEQLLPEFEKSRKVHTQSQLHSFSINFKRTGSVLEEPPTQNPKSLEEPIPSMLEILISPVGTSPPFSQTQRKSIAHKPLIKPKSTLSTLDLDAPAQTFLKVIVDDDSDDEEYVDEVWSAVVGWELISTPLGEVNALYRINGTTKHFTTLRQILYLVDCQDLMRLYGLVVKHYEHHPAVGFGLLFWGDLQVLFDSQVGRKGSSVWKNQHKWQIRSWRLYTLSNVHVLETTSGEVLSMFTDVSYPLTVKLMTKMLMHKLEIVSYFMGNDLTTAEQLIQFLKNQIVPAQASSVTQNWMVITFHVPFWNDKWLVQGGTTLELASPEQTATGKDVSNSFMVVMVFQKPLGYFSSPLIHVPRAGLVINPPG
nr:hypothetical protein [Tanacetum cinerariifolium]